MTGPSCCTLLATPAPPIQEISLRRFSGRGFDFDPAAELGDIKGRGTLGILPENSADSSLKPEKVAVGGH